ncbi:hypothetical protein BESB_067740 [Besnoitia besnoiti]|uniref:Non-specific serine/threonine protein kinase n=1 Tax=Besnoitia besnoiti TaxID=94643 RepID=A0A2A9MEQ1_BESBE|nr:hypothetical protein BESB_067740 [Besnoitia besnoiti]PFH34741.1 hypothetical protein BESB_067740 [Besnoitia besnoiti]
MWLTRVVANVLRDDTATPTNNTEASYSSEALSPSSREFSSLPQKPSAAFPCPLLPPSSAASRPPPSSLGAYVPATPLDASHFASSACPSFSAGAPPPALGSAAPYCLTGLPPAETVSFPAAADSSPSAAWGGDLCDDEALLRELQAERLHPSPVASPPAVSASAPSSAASFPASSLGPAPLHLPGLEGRPHTDVSPRSVPQPRDAPWGSGPAGAFAGLAGGASGVSCFSHAGGSPRFKSETEEREWSVIHEGSAPAGVMEGPRADSSAQVSPSHPFGYRAASASVVASSDSVSSRPGLWGVPSVADAGAARNPPAREEKEDLGKDAWAFDDDFDIESPPSGLAVQGPARPQSPSAANSLAASRSSSDEAAALSSPPARPLDAAFAFSGPSPPPALLPSAKAASAAAGWAWEEDVLEVGEQSPEEGEEADEAKARELETAAARGGSQGPSAGTEQQPRSPGRAPSAAAFTHEGDSRGAQPPSRGPGSPSPAAASRFSAAPLSSAAVAVAQGDDAASCVGGREESRGSAAGAAQGPPLEGGNGQDAAEGAGVSPPLPLCARISPPALGRGEVEPRAAWSTDFDAFIEFGEGDSLPAEADAAHLAAPPLVHSHAPGEPAVSSVALALPASCSLAAGLSSASQGAYTSVGPPLFSSSPASLPYSGAADPAPASSLSAVDIHPSASSPAATSSLAGFPSPLPSSCSPASPRRTSPSGQFAAFGRDEAGAALWRGESAAKTPCEEAARRQEGGVVVDLAVQLEAAEEERAAASRGEGLPGERGVEGASHGEEEADQRVEEGGRGEEDTRSAGLEGSAGWDVEFDFEDAENSDLCEKNEQGGGGDEDARNEGEPVPFSPVGSETEKEAEAPLPGGAEAAASVCLGDVPPATIEARQQDATREEEGRRRGEEDRQPGAEEGQLAGGAAAAPGFRQGPLEISSAWIVAVDLEEARAEELAAGAGDQAWDRRDAGVAQERAAPSPSPRRDAAPLPWGNDFDLEGREGRPSLEESREPCREEGRGLDGGNLGASASSKAAEEVAGAWDVDFDLEDIQASERADERDTAPEGHARGADVASSAAELRGLRGEAVEENEKGEQAAPQPQVGLSSSGDADGAATWNDDFDIESDSAGFEQEASRGPEDAKKETGAQKAAADEPSQAAGGAGTWSDDFDIEENGRAEALAAPEGEDLHAFAVAPSWGVEFDLEPPHEECGGRRSAGAEAQPEDLGGDARESAEREELYPAPAAQRGDLHLSAWGDEFELDSPRREEESDELQHAAPGRERGAATSDHSADEKRGENVDEQAACDSTKGERYANDGCSDLEGGEGGGARDEAAEAQAESAAPRTSILFASASSPTSRTGWGKQSGEPEGDGVEEREEELQVSGLEGERHEPQRPFAQPDESSPREEEEGEAEEENAQKEEERKDKERRKEEEREEERQEESEGAWRPASGEDGGAQRDACAFLGEKTKPQRRVVPDNLFDENVSPSVPWNAGQGASTRISQPPGSTNAAASPSPQNASLAATESVASSSASATLSFFSASSSLADPPLSLPSSYEANDGRRLRSSGSVQKERERDVSRLFAADDSLVAFGGGSALSPLGETASPVSHGFSAAAAPVQLLPARSPEEVQDVSLSPASRGLAITAHFLPAGTIPLGELQMREEGREKQRQEEEEKEIQKQDEENEERERQRREEEERERRRREEEERERERQEEEEMERRRREEGERERERQEEEEMERRRREEEEIERERQEEEEMERRRREEGERERERQEEEEMERRRREEEERERERQEEEEMERRRREEEEIERERQEEEEMERRRREEEERERQRQLDEDREQRESSFLEREESLKAEILVLQRRQEEFREAWAREREESERRVAADCERKIHALREQNARSLRQELSVQREQFDTEKAGLQAQLAQLTAEVSSLRNRLLAAERERDEASRLLSSLNSERETREEEERARERRASERREELRRSRDELFAVLARDREAMQSALASALANLEADTASWRAVWEAQMKEQWRLERRRDEEAILNKERTLTELREELERLKRASGDQVALCVREKAAELQSEREERMRLARQLKEILRVHARLKAGGGEDEEPPRTPEAIEASFFAAELQRCRDMAELWTEEKEELLRRQQERERQFAEEVKCLQAAGAQDRADCERLLAVNGDLARELQELRHDVARLERADAEVEAREGLKREEENAQLRRRVVELECELRQRDSENTHLRMQFRLLQDAEETPAPFAFSDRVPLAASPRAGSSLPQRPYCSESRASAAEFFSHSSARVDSLPAHSAPSRAWSGGRCPRETPLEAARMREQGHAPPAGPLSPPVPAPQGTSPNREETLVGFGGSRAQGELGAERRAFAVPSLQDRVTQEPVGLRHHTSEAESLRPALSAVSVASAAATVATSLARSAFTSAFFGGGGGTRSGSGGLAELQAHLRAQREREEKARMGRASSERARLERAQALQATEGQAPQRQSQKTAWEDDDEDWFAEGSDEDARPSVEAQVTDPFSSTTGSLEPTHASLPPLAAQSPPVAPFDVSARRGAGSPRPAAALRPRGTFCGAADGPQGEASPATQAWDAWRVADDDFDFSDDEKATQEKAALVEPTLAVSSPRPPSSGINSSAVPQRPPESPFGVSSVNSGGAAAPVLDRQRGSGAGAGSSALPGELSARLGAAGACSTANSFKGRLLEPHRPALSSGAQPVMSEPEGNLAFSRSTVSEGSSPPAAAPARPVHASDAVIHASASESALSGSAGVFSASPADLWGGSARPPAGNALANPPRSEGEPSGHASQAVASGPRVSPQGVASQVPSLQVAAPPASAGLHGAGRSAAGPAGASHPQRRLVIGSQGGLRGGASPERDETPAQEIDLEDFLNS